MKILLSLSLSFLITASTFTEPDVFFNDLANSSSSTIQSVPERDESELLLWGQEFPQAQEFGDGVLHALENWSSGVKPAQGLALQDFIDQSDQSEVKALSKLLKSLILTGEPSTEDEFYVTKKRYYNFDKNLLHTRSNLNDDGQDISRVSLRQFMSARTKGWGDHQDDGDDLYLVRDFLFGLQKAIESRADQPSPMLKRIRSKIHSIVDKALRAYSRSNDGSDVSGILRRWNDLQEASSSSILREFPWKMIADNDPGLGRYRPAFQWGNSIIGYLLLSYIRLYSVELIFWFSQSPRLLEQLAVLGQMEGKVNLLEAERKLAQKSSILWVQDLVNASREEPAFRGIARKVFKAYLSFVTRPKSFRPEIDFLQKRVGDVLALEEIQQAKQSISQEEAGQTLESLLNEPGLEETFRNLNKIQSVQGADISDEARQTFEKEAGLSFQDFASTGGDREKLRTLIEKSIPDGENPDQSSLRIQAIHSAVKKLSSSGALDDAVEGARNQKVQNSLKGSEEGSKYFSVENGRLILNGAIFQKLSKGVDERQVDKAYKSFKIEVSDTQSRLTNLKSLSQELQGSLNDIEFLTKDLSTMGVQLENNSQDSYLDEARRLGLQIDALSRASKEAIKNLDNLKEKFEHARDRLATVLQIKPQELGSDAKDLTARIMDHLGRSAFNDEKLAGDLDEILGLLSEINDAALEVQKLSDTISKNREALSSISTRLLKGIQESLERKDVSAEHAANLKKMHADLYPRVHYLNESEREEVQAGAPMAAHIDSAMANAFASKYLSGFVRKSNQSKNRVESVNFTHIDEEVLRVEVILTYVEMNPDFSETEVRKRISLDLVPRVVKTQDGHFDFIIRSLSLARDGSEKVELKTEFGIILESTMSLLNQLVEQLNDTPYAQLRFDYYPHLSLLRVKNGIPIFSSFPNFKVSDVVLEEGRIHLFGGVPGEELGQFIGQSIGRQGSPKASTMGERSSEPTNPQDFEKVERREPLPEGDVTIRVSQKLVNDFYKGFRSGFLSNHKQDVQDTSLEGRVVSFFRGLEEFNMDYLAEGKINAYLRGNLNEISKETADFFQQAVKIIAPFQGFRKGLKQGASHVIRFITFGKVEIEVNPDDYKVPSGEFAITLSGESKFTDPALEMNFQNLSLYDPVHHGALQPYIKLVRVAASVARVAGKVRDGLKSVINLIPGVEMEIKGDNLDEVIFSYIAKLLVSQTNQNINGVKITPQSYQDYQLVFEEFQLIDGVAARIKGIEIQERNLTINSRVQ